MQMYTRLQLQLNKTWLQLVLKTRINQSSSKSNKADKTLHT